MRLGEFEVATRPINPDAEPDTFEFEGEEFTVAPEQGAMPILEWMEAAQDNMSLSDPRSLEITLRLLQTVVADDDWPRFKRHAAAKRAKVEDLLRIVYGVWEAQAGRPTSPSSDSSDGRSDTGESSREPSSSEASSPQPPSIEGARRRRSARVQADYEEMRRQGLRSIDEMLRSRRTG